jgi:murein DD-endopeptidase MepM/ murein hydrolase activator NlpD
MQLASKPLCLSATAVSIIAATTIGYWRSDSSPKPQDKTPGHRAPAAPKPEPRPPQVLPIASGDTLTHVLLREGIDRQEIGQILEAVSPSFDVRDFRAGSELLLTRSGMGAIERIEYVIDADRKLTVSHRGDTYASELTEIPSTLRITPVCSTLNGSLFESIQSVGERPELAVHMAEIFKWDIDFFKDPQPGDEFCLLFEKKEYANGQPSGYGRILSARYNNAGEVHEAYLFADEKGKDAWFAPDGRSLQAAFLRSPIKFDVRVSSRFSKRRFHPVLRRYRPHLGTDYAAPTGTPVMAVADGRVVFSGRTRGAGNLVRVQHANGYETQYLHLSRRLVRNGQRVQQGQRIGLVGATGLATGPHLDLRISRNGQFYDYEKLRAPKKSRVAANRMAAFTEAQREYARLMEGAAPSVMARVSTEPVAAQTQ